MKNIKSSITLQDILIDIIKVMKKIKVIRQ